MAIRDADETVYDKFLSCSLLADPSPLVPVEVEPIVLVLRSLGGRFINVIVPSVLLTERDSLLLGIKVIAQVGKWVSGRSPSHEGVGPPLPGLKLHGPPVSVCCP